MNAPLPFVPSPPATPEPGVCRCCGCSNENACILECKRVRLIGGGAEFVLTTCSWIDDSLCSRCHSPRNPTQAQAGEIARIESRHGPVRVGRGRARGQLAVTLVADVDIGPHFVVRPAVLTLDCRGRVVHRLEREVINREQIAA